MNEALDLIEKAKDMKLLICIGKGPKIFSSGFDLKEWASTT